jgi:flagellum-specific peptidoglycan hydrolase FlgJ
MTYRLSKLQKLVAGTMILVMMLSALLKSVSDTDDFYQMRLLELQMRETNYSAELDSAVFIALELELAQQNAQAIARAKAEADRLVAIERARIRAIRQRARASGARVAAAPVRAEMRGGEDARKIKEWERQRDNFDYSRMTRQQAAFVRTWFVTAKAEQARYGIPASVKMAQSMIETGCGTSRLAREGHNFFGIKRGRGWSGALIYAKDDDYKKGRLVASAFRKYNNAWYSWRDHSKFLQDNQRYNRLFNLSDDDYRGWARGLKRAGYATGANYDGKIIRLIESTGLNRMD